jgi:hypothetical protein
MTVYYKLVMVTFYQVGIPLDVQYEEHAQVLEHLCDMFYSATAKTGRRPTKLRSKGQLRENKETDQGWS